MFIDHKKAGELMREVVKLLAKHKLCVCEGKFILESVIRITHENHQDCGMKSEDKIDSYVG